MVRPVGPEDLDLTIKFGGGIHTRASEDEIEAREAANGTNFQLDIQNRELRNRKPFDLVGTVPNGLEIRGGGSILKADGTVATFFQAGGQVYDWDGLGNFTTKGTVDSQARLRGHWRSHNWTLGDILIVTDLNVAEVVQQWDGATDIADIVFSNESGSGFGNFFAKYVVIDYDRALYSNTKDVAALPHVMIGSEIEDYTVISSIRPSDALGEADPFLLTTPDLRPINGAVRAFGTTILSTEQGAIFNLTGASAKDFSFDPFYPGSGARGDESVGYIGNDIIYGRPGRIESVRDTDRFGDSETDDLTFKISDVTEDYGGWTTVYNSRLNRVYMFPEGESEAWVFQTAMLGIAVSPWMRWTTTHPLAFQPTFVMSMLDPNDGLEYVFMGDGSGNIYRLEGSGTSGDAGTNAIQTSWLTKLFSAPLNAQNFDVEGYIKYRKDVPATVELVFEYAGTNIFNETLAIDLPAVADVPYFGGDVWFGGDFYFGTISGRLSRQIFQVPGQSEEFQVRVDVLGNNDFDINEIGLRFRAASP